MKKVVMSLCLGFLLCVANASQIDAMNSNLESLLAPFQDQKTTIVLHFNALKQTPKKVNEVALNTELSKKGSQNAISLKVDNFSYDYFKGKTPTVRLDAAIGFGFRQIQDRDEVDNVFDSAEAFLKDTFDEYTTGKYGKAAKIHSEITSQKKDKEGHYSNLKGIVTLDVDLEKLPKKTNLKDIEVTAVSLSFELDIKKGFLVHGYVYGNPKHDAFNDKQTVLKDTLEKISLNDPKVMRDIYEGFSSANDLLDRFVLFHVNR